MGETRRLHYIDVLRVIACVMVIVIHVSSDYIYMGESTAGSSYVVGLVANTMSRSCIGLFLMISGALVLKKSMQLSKIVKHSLRYMYLYLLWGLFYAVVLVVNSGNYSIGNMIDTFLTGKYHLWYLLLIAFIYGIIPLFKSVDMKSLRWVCFLCILFGMVLPSVNFGGWEILENVVNVPIVAYIGYFILGNILSRVKGSVWFLVPLILAWAIRGSWMVRVCGESGVFSEYLSSYNNILVCIEVVCIFLIVKRMISKGNRVIELISSASFGIYLIHVLFIDILRYFGLFERLHVLVAVVLVFVVSFGVSWLIGLIKPLKWLIF